VFFQNQNGNSFFGSRSTSNIVSSAIWQSFTPASTSFLSIELRSYLHGKKPGTLRSPAAVW
jgi:hypothetical protein